MLTPNDYYKWVAYLSHKKPEVTEIQLAVLSTLVSNGLGGKAKVDDFLISIEKKQKEKPLTAFDSFNGIATEYKSTPTK